MSIIRRKLVTAHGNDTVTVPPEDSLILVCEQRRPAGQSVAAICRGLGAHAEIITEGEGLLLLLHYLQPVAVISDVVLDDQDGFNVMKGVAAYNRDLPMLMITGGDPALQGAVEAIEELWGMTGVSILDAPPSAVTLVHFIESLRLPGTAIASRGFRPASAGGAWRSDLL